MLIPKLYIFNPGFSLSYMEQIGAYLVCGSWQLEARWGGGWVEQLLQTLILFPLPASRSHLASRTATNLKLCASVAPGNALKQQKWGNESVLFCKIKA